MRRSTRLRAEIPVRLRSVDPKFPFDLLTRTVIINAQGCGLQSTAELPQDILVELDIEDRTATGRILNSTLVDADRNIYLTGVALDQSGNFWGIESPPPDWIIEAPRGPEKVHPFARKKAAASSTPKPAQVHPFAKPATPGAQPPSLKSTESIDARQAEFLQQAAARMTEIEERERSFRSSADQLFAQLTHQAEEAMAGLRRHVEEVVARHEDDLTARLAARQKEIAESGEVTGASDTQKLQAVAGQVLEQVEQGRLTAAESQAALLRAAEAALETIDARLQRRGEQIEAQAQAVASSLQEKLTAALQQLEEDISRKQGAMTSAAAAEISKVAEQARVETVQRIHSEIDAKRTELAAQIAEDATTAVAESRYTILKQIEADIAQKREQLASQLASETGKAKQDLAAEVGKAKDDARAALRNEGAQQVQAFREQLESATSQQRSDIAARAEELSAGIASLQAQHRQVSSDLAELQKTKGYIESIMSALPDTVRDHAQRHASESWERLRERAEQHIGETVQAENARGAVRLKEEIDASAQRLREEMAAHAQQTASEVQAKISEVIAQRQQQLVRELQEHVETFEARSSASATDLEAKMQRAAATVNAVPTQVEEKVRAAAEGATAHLAAEAQRQSELHRAQAEKVHADALRKLEEVAQRSDHLLGETEAALFKSASEIVNDEIARAQRDVRERAQSENAAALSGLREGAAKVLSDNASQIDAAVARSAGIAEKLQAFEAAAEAQSQALRAQLETAQRWLDEQRAEFQKTIHDAFLLAGGEIRGRVHAAVDTADELIQQRTKRALEAMENASAEQAQALTRQAEENMTRLNFVNAEVSSSAETQLKSRLEETLEVFRSDASRLAESALSRWQNAMNDTLRAIPNVLKDKLDGDTPPSKG